MIKKDNYLSYEIEKNGCRIKITDKYFAPYAVVQNIIEILDLQKKDNILDIKKQLYRSLDKVKISEVKYPLLIKLELKDEQITSAY